MVSTTWIHLGDEMLFVADLTAKPDAIEEVSQILRELADETRSEPGAVAYTVQREADRPYHFRVLETYRDREAFESHMTSPHVQRALARFNALLSEAPRMSSYEELVSWRT
jgi:quinol monooxygenase YgiN